MPGMPYHLEKGPVLSVLEDVLRGPTAQVENILTRLRDPSVPLAEVGGLDSTTLNAPPYPTTGDRVAHIEKDWFGYVVGTQQQAPFNPLTNPTTGFWENYWGDVAGIVRETLTRAVEVALGLDHDAEPPGTRHWPIELFWKCPNPWFEGWVTWRHEPSQPASGQVTVILATPGWQLTRYIDWLSVAAQLGLTLSGRPVSMSLPVELVTQSGTLTVLEPKSPDS